MFSLRVFLLLIVGTVSINGSVYDVVKPTEWWQTASIYQVWPRSFKDSDGDGVGDLNGITSKLEHLVDMGIDVLWLSPIHPSPMVDSGYDVADYRDILPEFGTLDDFDNLITRAKELGLKVIMDYVPNHTSDEHEWFIKSKASIEPYTDYYVWHEGIIDENGTPQPPNNWVNLFNTGSMWKWVEERGAFYCHQFDEGQPDLNFKNPAVLKESKDIITYWLDRGVSGFRVDALPFLVEDDSLGDEYSKNDDRYTPAEYYYYAHYRTRDLIGNYEIVKKWREHIDNYTAEKGDGIPRAMFGEAYANISLIMDYYNWGINVPFNFFIIRAGLEDNLAVLDDGNDVKDVVDLWMGNMPDGGAANWVAGNHDNPRIASRLGQEFVDAVNFLLFLLPGVATIFNGDELGMTDTYLTWEETIDPRACGTSEALYESYSRDPMRTPYQWDNSTSAGFSTNPDTILPVNENYLTLNLAAQKEADVSHYKNVQAAIKLRNTKVMREGSLNVEVIDDQVFAFVRELDGEQPIVVLINWNNSNEITISLDVFENVPDNLEVVIADINSGITVGDEYEKTSVTLPGNAAVVLRGIADQKTIVELIPQVVFKLWPFNSGSKKSSKSNTRHGIGIFRW